jgi:predicted RNA-binding Zn-ribbon protein involved in translation (DUF1610 family)
MLRKWQICRVPKSDGRNRQRHDGVAYRAPGALLNQARVFKEEQAACRASFDGIDWETDTLREAFEDFHCPKCSSTLVRNDNAEATKPDNLILVCSKCGEPADLDEVIEAALKESLSFGVAVRPICVAPENG